MNLFTVYIEAYLDRFLDVRFVGSVVVVIIMFWFILIAKVLIVGAVQSRFVSHFESRSGELILRFDDEGQADKDTDV